ncbi:MAG: B12-binding domain-containing protein [Gemmatimonadota bacterium]|jgi:methanogenic corrinoid protein MtbC1
MSSPAHPPQQEGLHDPHPPLAIPTEVSQAYDSARSQVVARVDAALFRRPDLGVLLGDASASVVRELNRYVAAFLSSVFCLRLPELLTHGLPRLLGGYRSRGVSTDYVELLPSLWREAVDEAMGSRATPIESVLRWMEEHPALWTPHDEEDRPPGETGGEAWLCDALLAGDAPAARSLLGEALDAGATLSDVFVDLIQPALYEIGRRWEDGRITAAQEHLASALVTRLLAGFEEGAASGDTRVAVVTTAPTETHEFAAWMVADVLRSGGWTVHFLGSQLPAEETLHFLRSVRPTLLAVSVTLEIHLPSLQELMRGLREDPELAVLPVLVGGQAFAGSDRIWRRIGADGKAEDVRSVLDEAERLLAARGAQGH